MEIRIVVEHVFPLFSCFNCDVGLNVDDDRWPEDTTSGVFPVTCPDCGHKHNLHIEIETSYKLETGD